MILFTDEMDENFVLRTTGHYQKGKFPVGEVRGSNDKVIKYFGLGDKKMPLLVGVCGNSNSDAPLAYEVYEKSSSSASADKLPTYQEINKFLAGETYQYYFCVFLYPYIILFLNHLKGFRQKTKCQILSRVANEQKAQRVAEAQNIFTLTRAQLKKKKISVLLDAIKNLNLPTEGLLEKDDYVNAIINANPNREKLEL